MEQVFTPQLARSLESVPVPGDGDTLLRWRALRDLGRGDLSLAKLAESHLDAVAILREAGHPVTPGARYAVWASASGATGLYAERRGDGWSLRGTLRFASGAASIERALVLAMGAEGRLLFDVDVTTEHWARHRDTWQTSAMTGSGTVEIDVRDAPVADASRLAGTGWYLERPGFWLGAVGVAAVWLGAVDATIDVLRSRCRSADDAHAFAVLGRLDGQLQAVNALLDASAHLVDEDAVDDLQTLALTIRTAVESLVDETLTGSARSIGPAALVFDAEHARRVHDLSIYVRQSHGPRDLEQLGRRLARAAG